MFFWTIANKNLQPKSKESEIHKLFAAYLLKKSAPYIYYGDIYILPES